MDPVNDTLRSISALLFKKLALTLAPCKPTPGCVSNNGYGVVRHDGKQWLAHRLAWFLAYGPIPRGMCVLHHCDVKTCIEPKHLFLGTIIDNNANMRYKGRQACGEKAAHSLGDAHWTRMYPERLPRGDSHWARRNPEWLARGKDNGSSLHPESVPRGEANGNSKLADPQAIEIRARYAAGGISQYALAREFNVTRATIAKIVTRKSWRHLP